MSGNKAGGLKATQAIKAKYGADHYKRIGSLGGKAHNKGGFKSNPELARIAGRKGGTISRRNKHNLTAEQLAELELLRIALQEEAAVVSY